MLRGDGAGAISGLPQQRTYRDVCEEHAHIIRIGRTHNWRLATGY
jgi:hypothetical protein